ncbi:hypothetical protein MCOR27_003575 [Pyricularia oryzae]|uniref:M-phase inducer phosphatase n=5 Tax=Pyricularia TaxID=48558 RepID=A0ABQ8NKZ7_PYRGI|nr:M-phase inducer phosphatase [Pyricularia oryzae 70-15]ELQ41288.1 M-phase inducer phosphatase [Pyricularia oryzae Y34]KAH8848323.1 hypothetical protein MCOR01_001700 [Pyricularia oryzae]KAI6298185.1 hypothetical protein MCOR33_005644 [Pyricularia grisea]EHA53134.1 M-phase inducer phosphatase [Pyricularia oryzae 70-15]KAH9429732.1 hypothetical protein MCOR02_009469 [Pyricularia oryzae]
MEDSSPLAAIRRPTHLFGDRLGGYRTNIGHYSPDSKPRAFNLREQLGIHNSKKAYLQDDFSRGSSPSICLAADLGQNFRIDQDSSPKFPTPRRALFTSMNMGDMGMRDCTSAPPLMSSPTPGGLMEMMDISPLPHKLPATSSLICESQVESPVLMDDTESNASSEKTEDESASIEPSLPQPTTAELPRPLAAERRRIALRRPSLSRAKGYSTSALLTRGQPDNQLPPFRFGGNPSLSRESSSLSLSECFQNSPTPEKRPSTANSPIANVPGPLRVRTQFSSLNGSSASRTGSPISSHSRRPSNPFMRPRKQYRRSLSMFENSGEVMKPKQEEPPAAPALSSVMDIEEPAEPILPHFFPEGESDNIPRIKRQTLLDVLDGQYNERYDNKLIIDCRFEYEYDGGHIDGAINYNDKDLLVTHLLRTPMEGRTLIVFHCEYSAHRAPLMARHVRAEDRSANAEHYPRLTYPEIYILEGGYSGFFEEHRDRCYPQAYVEMGAAEHAFTCEREMGRLRQNRKGLSRAATYAFGTGIQDSPTAPGRSTCQDSPMSMLGASPILGSDRFHGRRMASY